MPQPLLHSGRVVWQAGSPVGGALVAVASGTAPTPEIAIRADADGRFRIALPNGGFEIEARAQNGITGRLALTVRDKQEDFEIVLGR